MTSRFMDFNKSKSVTPRCKLGFDYNWVARFEEEEKSTFRP